MAPFTLYSMWMVPAGTNLEHSAHVGLWNCVAVLSLHLLSTFTTSKHIKDVNLSWEKWKRKPFIIIYLLNFHGLLKEDFTCSIQKFKSIYINTSWKVAYFIKQCLGKSQVLFLAYSLKNLSTWWFGKMYLICK